MRGVLKEYCSIDECDRPCHGRGMCAKHYTRWRKTGKTEDPQPPPRLKCVEDGCTNDQLCRGWCSMHYQRWYKYGDPSLVVPPHRNGRLGYCLVCSSPSMQTVDAMLASGAWMMDIVRTTGITAGAIIGHSNHGPFPYVAHPPGSRPCQVCEHPDLDGIEAVLDERRQWRGRNGSVAGSDRPEHLQWATIEARFGLSRGQLRGHDTPTHQARRAVYELGRLAAITTSSNAPE